MPVIWRLNRGAFVGQVVQHDDGPWSGWYSYTWSAGPVGGGAAMLGKSAALAGLNNAMLAYFANNPKNGQPQLRVVHDRDRDTT